MMQSFENYRGFPSLFEFFDLKVEGIQDPQNLGLVLRGTAPVLLRDGGSVKPKGGHKVSPLNLGEQKHRYLKA
jgi:hypothetical protein